LTPEEFERLLEILVPGDRDAAGRKYEEIRQRLIRLFRARSCTDPEGLADDTIDRAAKRFLGGLEVKSDDPTAFFCGIAGNLAKERIRKEVTWKKKLESHPGPTAEEPPDLAEAEEDRRRQASLRKCLKRLTEDQRALVLDYYAGSRIAARHRLAETLGVTPNALRIRAHRIRLQLEECTRRSLALRLAGTRPES
jgi:DNA-directed RNA polymerase specialized sigma24 family protein